MVNRTPIYLLLLPLLLLGNCSPVKHSFSERTNLNGVLLKRITYTTNTTTVRIPSGKSIRMYRTVFREYQVEKNNVLEYSVINDSSKKERVTYKEFIGYWQEIYLFRLPAENDKNESFVYFSVRFRAAINKETRKADTVCIGFGPSYLGRLYARENEYVIHFEKTLKPVKTQGHFELDTKKRADLKFVIRKKEYSSDMFKVSRIVSAENNKIGGDKNLVYETESIFNDSLGLTFYYLRSFTLK
jgi:hypothetical protein